MGLDPHGNPEPPFGPGWEERARLAKARDKQHEDAMATWERVEGRAMRRGVAMGRVLSPPAGTLEEERRKQDAVVALGNALSALQAEDDPTEGVPPPPKSMVCSVFRIPGPGESWEVRVFAEESAGSVACTLGHAKAQPRVVLERAIEHWRRRRRGKVDHARSEA